MLLFCLHLLHGTKDSQSFQHAYISFTRFGLSSTSFTVALPENVPRFSLRQALLTADADALQSVLHRDRNDKVVVPAPLPPLNMPASNRCVLLLVCATILLLFWIFSFIHRHSPSLQTFSASPLAISHSMPLQ